MSQKGLTLCELSQAEHSLTQLQKHPNSFLFSLTITFSKMVSEAERDQVAQEVRHHEHRSIFKRTQSYQRTCSFQIHP